MEIIAIDKPYGWRSTQVVEWVKRTLGVRKAGHAGTLDPLATGLILVAVDRATRYLAELQALPKEYYVLVIFGYSTRSGDAEFAPEPVQAPKPLGLSERKALLAQFTGRILQRPPVFSAIKVQGKRAYALARAGQSFTLAPRLVEIYALEEVYYEPPARWLLRLSCSKGTYVRSLAEDLGRVTGWGAYVGALRRTRIGSYSVSDAIQPERYTSA
ncbi:MAG: tRNA pseudouridine(55) synthase TruB [Bacteroidia bacterium]|nr:tRNA pseudouridine(55) synthase TruB [Bacteroidia bacterium]MDW8088341.1 tRNA pseudouridine(55) synthase TruB [Bacteroidia bacterium]